MRPTPLLDIRQAAHGQTQLFLLLRGQQRRLVEVQEQHIVRNP
jgi:hypothetical protein